MSDKNDDQLKSAETSSALRKLWNEWKIFLWGFFRPLVIMPLAITVVFLIIANKEDVDRTLSLVLQIIAALLTAIAGKFFYDVIRNVFESNILIKKGLSAVRNLALARSKTKNISDRVKTNATSEEIKNLLALLEKDIANATQEWNDILPGVSKIEEVYTLLAEKELESELVKREKEQLNKQLLEEKQLSQQEQENLKKNLVDKNKKISELTNEINKLRVATGSLSVSGSAFPVKNPYWEQLYSLLFSKKCAKCGKLFRPKLEGQQICDECSRAK